MRWAELKRCVYTAQRLYSPSGTGSLPLLNLVFKGVAIAGGQAVKIMTTGDIKGILRKLEQKLRMISYPRDVDYSGLVKGEPAASLPIISYTFTGYSTHIAEILVSLDVELSAKSDLRFIDAVYKVLRDIFHYKPILTKQQFLQFGFSERKIQTVCDIIECVVKKHKEIANQSKVKVQQVKKMPSAKCEVFYQEGSSVQPATSDVLIQKKMLVERHVGSDIPALESTGKVWASSTQEEISNSDSEAECSHEDVVWQQWYGVRVPQRENFLRDTSSDQKCQRPWPEHQVQVTKDTQIELLKAQLAGCQEKLSQLEWMEDRLQALENSMKGKIIIDETDWNNLLSRVLLLETDRLLQSRKKDLATEFPSISQEHTSSRITDETSQDFNAKADIPEHNRQSSGYNSLLCADTSHIAGDINYSRVIEDSNQVTTKQRMDRLARMLEETSELLKYSNTS